MFLLSSPNLGGGHAVAPKDLLEARGVTGSAVHYGLDNF
jgi:hypothetical protein